MDKEKYKIIALFGKSGAGKDTVCNYLAKQLSLHKAVCFTTRPPREGEKEGVDYYFLDNTNLIPSNRAAVVSYNNWSYGITDFSLSKEKINVGVFSINMIKELLKNSNYEILPIMIDASDKIRLERLMNRESYPNYYEICRRFISDYHDYQELIPFNFETYQNIADEVRVANLPAVKKFLS